MRILSRSVVGRALATLVVIGLFVVLYEATTSDSTEVAAVDTDRGAPAPGAVLQFAATAYCKGTTTASGVVVRTGIAAADPTLLPVGSVVNVATDTLKYNGVYTIMDTGPKVQGRLLDLYMWSCYEALDFGRKPVRVTVLRLGWNPSDSAPSLIDRLFREREQARDARRRQAVPVPQGPVPETAIPPTSFDGAAPGPDAVGAVPPLIEPPPITPPPAQPPRP